MAELDELFLRMDESQQKQFLGAIDDAQKQSLFDSLNQRKQRVSDLQTKIKPQPFKTDLGEKASKFLRQDLPGAVKGAADVYLQFGAGMVDTLDDLGRLLGADIKEPEQEELPDTAIERAARFTGTFFSPSIPGAGGSIGAINNALKTPGNLAKAQRVKNFLQPIANASKKSVAFVGELLSSVPQEIYEKAISKPEILKKPFEGAKTWRNIGEKAQKAVNYVTKEAGKQVREETDLLSNVSDLIDAEKYATNISDLASQTIKGRVQTLSGKGRRLVGQVENQLLDLATDPEMGGKVTAQELHGVKKQIDNLVSYNSETVKQLGDVGERLLKDVRKTINSDLREISADYAAANDKFSKIAEINNVLKTRLKDKKLATNIKSIANAADTFELNILKELDEVAPKALKFVDDIDSAVINEPFSQLFPGRGGGSGGQQGGANIMRVLLSGITGGVTAPLFSPAVQGQIIKRAPETARKAAQVIGQTAPRAAIQLAEGLQQ